MKSPIFALFRPYRAVMAGLLALGMIGASVSAGVLSVMTTQLSNRVGQRVMHDLRMRA
jgi:ATP-binding cassette subfamily B protein